MKPNFITRVSVSLITVMAAMNFAYAATYTWTKSVTDGTNLSTNWSAGTNWSGVPVSAADTTLVFGYTWTTNSTARTNTVTNNVADPFLLNVLTLGGANPTAGNGSNVALINIAGTALNFVSNGGTTPQVNLNQNRSAGQVVSFNVQSDVILTNDTLFTGNGTANFTFSGGISGAGILTKSGSSALALSGQISTTGGLVMNGGSLTLSNALNSYTGGTSISGGTLVVSSTGTLGQNINTNNVAIDAGARLDLAAAGNTGVNQTITLTSTAGSLATLALGYNGVPNATIAQADTNGGLIALNGVTGFTGNLSTVLTGKNLFLGSIGTSTFTGAAATLAAGNGNIYRLGGGGGSISFNTANQLTGANSVQIGSTATGGTGTVIFGAAQDYSGGTSINSGSTLRFDTRISMPASGTVTVNDGATLAVTVAGSGTTWGGGAGVAGIAGLTSTANSGEGFGGQTGALVNFDGNSSLNLNVTGNVSESNAIGNGTATSIRLIKSGASTLTLSGNNSYSGGTRLTAGTLIADSANALGTTGNITFLGGTLQYTANSAANDYGSRITNSTSAMLLNTNSQNVTLSNLGSGNTGGLTKSGAGILTLSGTNTYSGTTTVSAGSLVVENGTTSIADLVHAAGTSMTIRNGGTLNTTGIIGDDNVSNVTRSIIGGAATSTWNLGGSNFYNYGYSPIKDNNDMTIDGAGVAASAIVTNIATLQWGRSTSNSDLLVTNGGRLNVNSDVQIGSTYYGTTGINNTITIQGGTANSIMTVGQDFYVGFGDRQSPSSNTATVGAGGQLTVTRHMYVGHSNYADGGIASTTNQLTVSGSGTASMNSLSVGYAQSYSANANVVNVTNGGTISTTGASYIGRAAASTSNSNANTLTIGGTGSSSWNAGNQTVYVGHTNNATATSSNNILTVASGGSLSNVSSLFVGFGTGTEIGNKLVLNGGSLTATTVTVSASNSLEIGVNGGSLTGAIVNNGVLNISSDVAVTLAGNQSGSGSVTHSGNGTITFSGTNSYGGGTTVSGGTLTFLQTGSKSGTGTHAFAAGTTLGLGVNGASGFGESDITNAFAGTMSGNLTGITVTDTTHVGIDTTNGDFTYSGSIIDSPTKGLTKLGSNKLTISAANTYTGVTRISAGTLEVQGSITNSSSIVNNAALVFNSGSAQTYGNEISGTGTLSKQGAGTLILSGANTYTGTTTVSGGILRIHGSTSASSNFTVQTGGTLGGSGTIGGTITLESGSTLAPGASIESLASGSNVWNGGSTVEFEFSTNGSTGTAGAQWDLLAITGTLDLTGASSGNQITFDLVSMLDATTSGSLASWDPNANTTWSGIVTTTGGITGFASNLFAFDTSGFQNTLNGTFNISQNGNNLDLNYVTNYVIPEPKAALLGAIGVLLLFRRRR